VLDRVERVAQLDLECDGLTGGGLDVDLRGHRRWRWRWSRPAEGEFGRVLAPAQTVGAPRRRLGHIEAVLELHAPAQRTVQGAGELERVRVAHRHVVTHNEVDVRGQHIGQMCAVARVSHQEAQA
jgi:hypothetical protein